VSGPPSASPVAALVERYHTLMGGPLGTATAEAFQDGIARTRLVFGDRPICRVLRPFFLAAQEAAAIRSSVETLLGAFRKVLAALDRDRALRGLLRLTAADEAVLAADHQGFEPDQIARLDGFLVRGGPFRLVEYNAESPGGIAFGDALADIFRALPVMQVLAREHGLAAPSGLANTLRQLVAAHEARTGPAAARRPTIAVVDWKSAPTRREFEICAEFFERQGFPSRVLEPPELAYAGGRLVAHGVPIDIVYKRVLVGDLVTHGGADHPLVRAVREGAVTCASRFQVHLLYRKELFALFHDERLTHAFSESERAAIRSLIPWSRIVEDVPVTDGASRVGLFDLVRRRRDRLVLKPTSQYGGKGVVLGWLASPEEWEDALRAAREEPYLVQERVELPSETFPVLGRNGFAFERFYADVNPYVWGGVRSEGFGARLAAGELLNVTAGGGSAVPVFVVG
jgi:hypothetical protein